jgi:hypothetical protein
LISDAVSASSSASSSSAFTEQANSSASLSTAESVTVGFVSGVEQSAPLVGAVGETVLYGAEASGTFEVLDSFYGEGSQIFEAGISESASTSSSVSVEQGFLSGFTEEVNLTGPDVVTMLVFEDGEVNRSEPLERVTGGAVSPEVFRDVNRSWELRRAATYSRVEGLSARSEGRFHAKVGVENEGNESVNVSLLCESPDGVCSWNFTFEEDQVEVPAYGYEAVDVSGRVPEDVTRDGLLQPSSHSFRVVAVSNRSGGVVSADQERFSVLVGHVYSVVTNPLQSTALGTESGPGVGLPNVVWAALAAGVWYVVFFVGVEYLLYDREYFRRKRVISTAALFFLVMAVI